MGRILFYRYIPWLPLVAAAFVYQPGNQNAHIAYEGDISVTWRTVTRSGHDCTLRLGPQNHSWFYVGVHPSWDLNPLFFEISHVSSVVCGLTGGQCVDYEGGGERRRGETVYTNDEIYNLDFASSVGVVGRDGTVEGRRVVDFGRAEVVSASKDGGEEGYLVRFGRESWLEVGGVEEGVVLRYRGEEQEILELEERCFLDAASSRNLLKFNWTGAHDDFSVQFSFTNSYANATFYLKLNKTEMTLSFTGARNISDVTNSDWNLPEVDLDTSNRQVPRFKWRTGGPVIFATESAAGGGTPTETGSVLGVEPVGTAARPQNAVPSAGETFRGRIWRWRIWTGFVVIR
ncbi:hypothetical protein TWF696_003013 [Orbilia brochopaga]|uniref:Uncharacterized protein n=1 Tax=Orbilia brochopaga TaxID=3140254 RepID=A0AAV9U2H4_9PEZI